MKSKYIAVFLLIAVTACSWLFASKNQNQKELRIAVLISEVEKNLKVETYKNTLPLYEELISLDSDNACWYVQLAEAYRELNQYGNYQRTCERLISRFPEDKTGYAMLLNYHLEGGDYVKLIAAYGRIPDDIKAVEAIAEVYQAVEWQYRYLAKSFSGIAMLPDSTYLVWVGDFYGYYDSKCSEIIAPMFDKARPFIEEYAAVYKDDEWYFIDFEGDRVIATKEPLEDLYSFSEGYAAAKLGGKYGYVDKDFEKYCFEYEDATSFYNGVAAVKKHGKWALINTSFALITEHVFDNIIIDAAGICSRRGLVFAGQGGHVRMLDLVGKAISDDEYEDAYLMLSNYAAVKKDGKWGFVDDKGAVVIDFQYDGAKSFNAGIAPVAVEEDWGYIDETGRFVVPPEFNDAEIASARGTAVVDCGNGYRFIEFYKYR